MFNDSHETVLYEWLCQVIEIDKAKKTFIALMVDLKTGELVPNKITEFKQSMLTKEENSKLHLGAMFKWSLINLTDFSSSKHSTKSRFKFISSPHYLETDVKQVKDVMIQFMVQYK